MTTWAIVPLKAVPEAKRRLRGVLSDDERQHLVVWMFRRVLAALDASPGIDRIAVVGADRALVPAAGRFIADPGRGLNAALAHALSAVCEDGARSALIVPADVPLIAADDVAALLDAGGRTAIVPDRARAGTNALLMTPPDRFRPNFGPGSFDRHRDAAGDAVVLDLPRIMLDIDDADALDALRREGVTPPTLEPAAT